MALGTVPKHFDQHPAALLFGAQIALHHPAVAQEQQLPAAKAGADVERKRHRVRRARGGVGGQGGEVGVQVDHLLRLHPDIGGIGEGGVVMPPVRRGAVVQRVPQIERGPATDSVLRVGADIGRGEAAEGRGEALPARQHQPVVAARPVCHVAGGATGRGEHLLAGACVAGETGQHVRPVAARPGDPEPEGNGEHGKDQGAGKPAAHGSLRNCGCRARAPGGWPSLKPARGNAMPVRSARTRS